MHPQVNVKGTPICDAYWLELLQLLSHHGLVTARVSDQTSADAEYVVAITDAGRQELKAYSYSAQDTPGARACVRLGEAEQKPSAAVMTRVVCPKSMLEAAQAHDMSPATTRNIVQMVLHPPPPSPPPVLRALSPLLWALCPSSPSPAAGHCRTCIRSTINTAHC
jgi:hypothetical protein